MGYFKQNYQEGLYEFSMTSSDGGINTHYRVCKVPTQTGIYRAMVDLFNRGELKSYRFKLIES